ncbi:MAG: hypothetical protein U1E76_05075 [Planctomycetota bacterium]
MRKTKMLGILVLLAIVGMGAFAWSRRHRSKRDPPRPVLVDQRLNQQGMQKLQEQFDQAKGDPLEAAAKQLAPDQEPPSEDLYFYEQFLRNVPEQRRANLIDLLKRKRQSGH